MADNRARIVKGANGFMRFQSSVRNNALERYTSIVVLQFRLRWPFPARNRNSRWSWTFVFGLIGLVPPQYKPRARQYKHDVVP